MIKSALLYNPTVLPVGGDDVLEGEDGRTYSHLGFYLYNFGAAEFHLTILLWAFTGHQPPASFHILTRGMDAKAKVVRLKEAVALHGSKIGPNLKARLSHFSEGQANLRNRIAHNYIYWEGDDLKLSNFGALPMSGEFSLGDAPETISLAALFQRACWLNRFTEDLISVSKSLPPGLPPPKGLLEIANPQSGVPTGSHADHP
ncbi:MAG TPA: hypothetical protein VGG92_21915 [Caulobacteraceae bacterium]|jgi:hypothetical protein